MKKYWPHSLAALCLAATAQAQLAGEALWKKGHTSKPRSPGNSKAPGDFVFKPLTFPNGAFVGIQGAPRSDKVRDTVPGEKGSVIADVGKVPAIPNLYEAQLRLRVGK